MSIKQKLLAIQQELKVPKKNRNTFGDYMYRNCEDILEEVKPLCAKHNAVLTIQDDVILVGDRYYIRATAILRDVDIDESILSTALAREELEKKKYDASQLTGSASSYARKYALNGLLAIDDTKDPDNTNNGTDGKQENKNDKTLPKPQKTEELKLTRKQRIMKTINGTGITPEDIAAKLKSIYGNISVDNLSEEDYQDFLLEIEEAISK